MVVIEPEIEEDEGIAGSKKLEPISRNVAGDTSIAESGYGEVETPPVRKDVSEGFETASEGDNFDRGSDNGGDEDSGEQQGENSLPLQLKDDCYEDALDDDQLKQNKESRCLRALRDRMRLEHDRQQRLVKGQSVKKARRLETCIDDREAEAETTEIDEGKFDGIDGRPVPHGYTSEVRHRSCPGQLEEVWLNDRRSRAFSAHALKIGDVGMPLPKIALGAMISRLTSTGDPRLTQEFERIYFRLFYYLQL